MDKWRFGTVLHRFSSNDIVVMVVGRNNDSRFATSDGLSADLSSGEWIGLTLVNYLEPVAWGKPGQTTWLLDESWEIVDD